MTNFEIQAFEDSAKENGQRYWDAHEFMVALGYENWGTFQKVINKAIASCAQLGITIGDVFIPHTIVEGQKVTHTFKLTRFACFLVSMHADSKKPEVAQAKIALAALADALIQEKIESDSFERIELREELKGGENIMSGVAKGAGLQPTQYGIFKDAGIRGMYNMSLRELITYKRAPGDKTLYDYMGKTELAANLFRVTQTAERIKHQKASGLTQISRAAQDVGVEVRDVMMRSGGTPPERLALEEDISNVKKRIKSTHKEMKRLDGKPAPKKNTDKS
ncbi:MAG TPA: BRO family protein [Sedimentisphaerales bacterium]